jgi:hypothetical protein
MPEAILFLAILAGVGGLLLAWIWLAGDSESEMTDEEPTMNTRNDKD